MRLGNKSTTHFCVEQWLEHETAEADTDQSCSNVMFFYVVVNVTVTGSPYKHGKRKVELQQLTDGLNIWNVLCKYLRKGKRFAWPYVSWLTYWLFFKKAKARKYLTVISARHGDQGGGFALYSSNSPLISNPLLSHWTTTSCLLKKFDMAKSETESDREITQASLGDRGNFRAHPAKHTERLADREINDWDVISKQFHFDATQTEN